MSNDGNGSNDGNKRPHDSVSIDSGDSLSTSVNLDLSGCSVSPTNVGTTKRIKLQTDDNFICAICMYPIVSPTILPCSHVFCIGCIEELAASPSIDCKCPLCKAEFNDDARFAVNKILDQIIRGVFDNNSDYKDHVKECNRKRFMNVVKILFKESKYYDSIKCNILDTLFEDDGYKHYNELMHLIATNRKADETGETDVFPDYLWEYNFVLKEMIKDEELIECNNYIIDHSCVDDFLKYYKRKGTISSDDMLCLLSVYGSPSSTMLEEYLEQYKHQCDKLFTTKLIVMLKDTSGSGSSKLDIEKYKRDCAPLTGVVSGTDNTAATGVTDVQNEDFMDQKVLFLPSVAKAVGVTYTPDVLGIDQEKFNKIMLALKVKYHVTH